LKKRSEAFEAKGFVLALLLWLVVCMFGIVLLSEVILGNKIQEDTLKILIPILLTVATLTGCIVCKRTVKARLILTAGVLALLLISGLFIDGEFAMLGKNVLGVGVGVVISSIVCRKKVVKSGRRKIWYR